jgi:hypothetical protein
MDVAKLQGHVVLWANSAFPNRTPSSAFMKLFGELGEVIRDPEDPGEWADLLILILDLMAMHGHWDPAQAVLDKLEINRRRTWAVNALGVMQHKE